jgi:hypothetical protein
MGCEYAKCVHARIKVEIKLSGVVGVAPSSQSGGSGITSIQTGVSSGLPYSVETNSGNTASD